MPMRRPNRPRWRLWCVLAVGLLAASAPAQDAAAVDAPLAELTVTAFGAQRFDLGTGFTELPDGGTVVDQGSGVRLEAPWLRYAEGERLEASEAALAGPFGTMDAVDVVLDLLRNRLSADGGVTLRADDGAVVRATSLRFDAGDGWLWAYGDVSGDTPTFRAATIGYDTETGRIVLGPPYAYEDGPLTLRAAADGAALQLTPERDEAGVIVGYDASTALDADVSERLAAASRE
jgi:hypothetical protein